MGTSFLLFRAFGIEVRVHWSFVLILAYGAFAFSAGPAGPVLGAFYGLVVIVLLFVCVTLHEFSHALVARRFKIGVRNITLLPIGGVANLERLPERPSQELLIAIAGPLMNFGLALILLPFLLWATELPSRFGPALGQLARSAMNQGALGPVHLLSYLVFTNLMLGLFNLLPAFPMDGGRVLRSLLAMALAYVQATRIAVYVGRVIAILLAVYGIYLWSVGGGGIMLLLIAFFVYIGGGAEREAVESRGSVAPRAGAPGVSPQRARVGRRGAGRPGHGVERAKLPDRLSGVGWGRRLRWRADAGALDPGAPGSRARGANWGRDAGCQPGPGLPAYRDAGRYLGDDDHDREPRGGDQRGDALFGVDHTGRYFAGLSGHARLAHTAQALWPRRRASQCTPGGSRCLSLRRHRARSIM